MTQLLIENYFHAFDYRMMNRQVKIYTPNFNLDDMETICKFVDGGRLELEKLKRLGSGASAVVYEYKDYAIKYFYGGIDSYYRDIPNLLRLQHLDCIPRLYCKIKDMDSGKDIAIVMSKVDGYTVSQYNRLLREGEIDNFINPRFNEIYRETVINIMKAGLRPIDLHDGNVMIDKNTGLPVIIDLGLFRKHDYKELVDLDAIDFQDFRDTVETNCWVCIPMEKCISKLYEDEANSIANEYKELMMGQIEAMGGMADIGELLH